MREKVTGIGKEIEKIMKENNISLEELEIKTGISKFRLKQFIELKKEPNIVPDAQKILPAIGLKTEKELCMFIEKWIELAKEKNQI